MARMTINGITIDPMKQAPALAAANLLSADASKSNFILVQVTAPLTPAQRKQLADLAGRNPLKGWERCFGETAVSGWPHVRKSGPTLC